MYTNSFRLVLADDCGITDDFSGDKLDQFANELYEAGCDDGLLGVSCGVLEVTFHREAERMRDAIRSAIEQVESTGCRVIRVESPDQPLFHQINAELAGRREPAAVIESQPSG